MELQNLVKIGWGNGLVPDGTKPLLEPMFTYHQWGSVALSWGHQVITWTSVDFFSETLLQSSVSIFSRKLPLYELKKWIYVIKWQIVSTFPMRQWVNCFPILMSSQETVGKPKWGSPFDPGIPLDQQRDIWWSHWPHLTAQVLMTTRHWWQYGNDTQGDAGSLFVEMNE